MSKITLTIDGKQVQVEKGKTILDAAKKINVKIPTLCYHEDLCVAGNCRVCVVEIEGQGALQASCAIPAQNGMAIRTNTPKVRNARKRYYCAFGIGAQYAMYHLLQKYQL
jgi:NADP-reducing hydrogenase subunit HndD